MREILHFQKRVWTMSDLSVWLVVRVGHGEVVDSAEQAPLTQTVGQVHKA